MKPKSTADKDPGSLDAWSDIIRRQGEEARRRDNEALAIAMRDLPVKIAGLPKLTNEDLLEVFVTFNCRGWHDSRMTKVWQEYADEARKVILGRMTR